MKSGASDLKVDDQLKLGLSLLLKTWSAIEVPQSAVT
jgi:hypothetical protein